MNTVNTVTCQLCGQDLPGVLYAHLRDEHGLTAPEKAPITVCVYDGLVQEVQNVPPRIQVRVQDYDLQGLPPEERFRETVRDENGDPCRVSVWESSSPSV